MALIPEKYQKTEDLNSSDVLPAGEYEVALVAATRDANDEGTRDWLNCQFRVQSGPFAGFTLFNRFYFAHENENTLLKSVVMWSKFLHACDVQQVVDSGELIGCRVLAKVTVSPAQNGYDASNWVRSFSPVAETSGADIDYDAPGANLTGFAEPQP